MYVHTYLVFWPFEKPEDYQAVQNRKTWENSYLKLLGIHFAFKNRSVSSVFFLKSEIISKIFAKCRRPTSETGSDSEIWTTSCFVLIWRVLFWWFYSFGSLKVFKTKPFYRSISIQSVSNRQLSLIIIKQGKSQKIDLVNVLSLWTAPFLSKYLCLSSVFICRHLNVQKARCSI